MKRIIARRAAIQFKELSKQDIKRVSGGTSRAAANEGSVWGEGCTPTNTPWIGVLGNG